MCPYQFIRSAGPKHEQPAIHHGLASSQAPVEEFEVKSKDGQTVLLVDTPGFNDTEKSDRVVLDDIMRFLKSRPVSFTQSKEDQKVAGIIYLLDASNRDYYPVSADRIDVPPSVVLATVQCHAAGPISTDVKRSLKSKYGAAYQEDHFGSANQYEIAWKIIRRVLDGSKNGVSVQPVIDSLEGILQSRTQAVGKGETITHLFLRKIFRFRATVVVFMYRLIKIQQSTVSSASFGGAGLLMANRYQLWTYLPVLNIAVAVE
ncbi:hypothetical protein D9619_000412 [Psilocybe cf. subviscida]|uniref:G domain-containing protein n=1 Tax=Psilocybe cf. subviscida TaxID=2480587 RepID=A0A8H5BG30_9AGAR|nr:hypothetical protein D9619_000412 [Psilocybe cf. subviscida]